MTMVSRKPRQIAGHAASRDKTSKTIQRMVDAAPEAEYYCTDGYCEYLDVVFLGKHIYNVHNKNDTFTAESVNADLRHYIPTLARRSRCFPRKLENLQAVLAFLFRPTTALEFIRNCIVPNTQVSLSLFLSLISFNCLFGHSPVPPLLDKTNSLWHNNPQRQGSRKAERKHLLRPSNLMRIMPP